MQAKLIYILVGVVSIFLALGLALLVTYMMARAAEDRDMARRIRHVLSPSRVQTRTEKKSRSLISLLITPMVFIGESLRNTAIISPKDLNELQRALASAGFNPQKAVPVFIGFKFFLVLGLPIIALAAIVFGEIQMPNAGYMVAATFIIAVMAPNWLLQKLKAPYQESLRKGLPDALDLMVVAAEAGLGLESAVDQVAKEMARTNPSIAMEFGILVQELRILPSRTMALERLAERTGMPGFKQLSMTLSQTLKFGTPLAQALRIMASDMRQERQIRLEEKAVKLPAKLILPLILFILPSLFIALIGPSILEMGKTFGGPSQ